MIAIRPFHEVDDPRLDGLLDAAPDPLWRSQGHRLHGPDRDGATWRRTVIAEDDGLVVGAGTIAVNAVHPTRYNAAVEVAPDHRRRGIGASLLSALRRLRSEPLPLAGKVRERDIAARAFVTVSGGRPYQRCSCPSCSSNSTDRSCRTVAPKIN